MTQPTPIVLVDDHPVVRLGLAYLLGEEPDFEVVGQAGDSAAALEVIGASRPAVVVLDLNLQGADAIPLITRLLQEWPELRILVLSMHEEDLYAERLLALGVHGYVMKHEEPAEFLRALRRVVAGETYLSPRLTERLVARVGRRARGGPSLAARLTGREHDVLQLVARGLGTREIATELGMRTKTVDSHRRNIREKLGLASSRDLVRYAVRWERESGGASRAPR
jgi:DNA-binding NarL/FixJ family response regulator